MRSSRQKADTGGPANVRLWPKAAVGGVTFEFATPVLDGLIRSGRLEIIRDPPVRVAISEWQHWLTQLDEGFALGKQFNAAQFS